MSIYEKPNKKKLALLGLTAFLIFVTIIFLPKQEDVWIRQSGKAYFLFIRVKNASATPIRNVLVSVKSIDPKIVVDKNSFLLPVLGPGAERILQFQLQPAEGTLPGKYAIEVTVSKPGQTEKRFVWLEVRE